MKTTKKVGAVTLVVMALVLGLAVTGCATNSSIGGTSDGHGFLASKAKVVAEGATEIASYSVILGLFDSKYPEYAQAVKAAQASGKKVTTVTKWLVFLTKTTAYAQ